MDRLFLNIFNYPTECDIAAAGLHKHHDVMIWLMNIMKKLPDFEHIISDNDLGLLAFLQEKHYICKINPNLAAKYNRGTIYNFLRISNLLTDEKMDTDLLVRGGCKNVLKYIDAELDSSHCDTAVKHNRLNIAKLFIDRSLYPNHENTIKLIDNNEAKIIGMMVHWLKRSGSRYLSEAIKYDKKEIVELFLRNNMNFDNNDFKIIIEKGDISLLRLLSCYRIFPDREHANLAVELGQFEILEWMEIGGILPTVEAANNNLISRQPHAKKMQKWLSDRNIYFDKEHLKSTALIDQKHVLKNIWHLIPADEFGGLAETLFEIICSPY